MDRTRRARLVTFMGVALGVFLLLPAVHAQRGKKDYAFRGRVERVDTKAKTLSVNGEDVPGWMMAMTMTYSVDKAEVIDRPSTMSAWFRLSEATVVGRVPAEHEGRRFTGDSSLAADADQAGGVSTMARRQTTRGAGEPAAPTAQGTSFHAIEFC